MDVAAPSVRTSGPHPPSRRCVTVRAQVGCPVPANLSRIVWTREETH